ncbi:type II restriction endonuclease [Oceanicaulis sp.]|uniref:type II restriction endonuclease n=1 Tax=Oceanicaulis sp. TaxID=1924941 RepID=UPI003F72B756
MMDNTQLPMMGREADLLNELFKKADRILVKKLSKNDRDWARYKNKHQGGVYIPYENRDGGFFPTLEQMNRADPTAKPIWHVHFQTIWPQAGPVPVTKKTRLVNYTSKGEETHMTGLPPSVLSELLPASFLIMGRIQDDSETAYECLTIDSASEEAALLAEMFDIGPDFLVDEFNPKEITQSEHDRVLDFAEQLIAAWHDGRIDLFARDHAAMPATIDLANLARQEYLTKQGLTSLNPFEIDAPGDALRDISRSIEWELFRKYQRRERAVALVRLVLGDEPVSISLSDVIRRLVDTLPAIDALMLSATQQRKARAGYSYEHHIEAMLNDGAIPFEKQVVIAAKKRPDFILPSLSFMENETHEKKTALILSAKTTLRERWKQVEREKADRNLYLTTVDENIAGNAIEDMASFGVWLVIPEALKDSKMAEYKGHENVLSFREFCDSVLAPNLGDWPATTLL